jgi:putative holliday junction resolvase
VNLKRIIGIDVGTKRVGLAQSDPTRTIASPIGTFSPDEILAKIVAEAQNIQTIVVGWPLSMRGHEGASTEMVTKFVDRIRKKLPDADIQFLDERFTSTIANQSIRQTVTSKKKRQDKGLVDTIAAAILLQSFLDRQSRIL